MKQYRRVMRHVLYGYALVMLLVILFAQRADADEEAEVGAVARICLAANWAYSDAIIGATDYDLALKEELVKQAEWWSGFIMGWESVSEEHAYVLAQPEYKIIRDYYNKDVEHAWPWLRDLCVACIDSRMEYEALGSLKSDVK